MKHSVLLLPPLTNPVGGTAVGCLSREMDTQLDDLTETLFPQYGFRQFHIHIWDIPTQQERPDNMINIVATLLLKLLLGAVSLLALSSLVCLIKAIFVERQIVP